MKAYLASLFILLLISKPLAAEQQGTGAIAGSVKDQSAAPVAGASVVLISFDRVLQTGTSSDGSFEFEHLQPGAYSLEITSSGFAKQASSLTIQEGAPNQTLSFVLRVGNQPDMDECGRDMSVQYKPRALNSPKLIGTVRDYSSGKWVANAEVKIVSETTGQTSAIMRSDKWGRFTEADLTPDSYNIQISCKDRSPAQLKRVVVPRENQVVIESTLKKRGQLVICQ
jgi:hypothetical protein